jgi:hypothetical protein
MAYPAEQNAFPSDPNSLSPETLRTWYVAMRDAFLSIVTELGNDPGGRLAALEVLGTSTKTASYVAALGDVNTMTEMSSASATTFTVPPNATVGFPVNSILVVGRYGTGTATLVAGAGVTIRSAGSLLALRAQYSVATLKKRGTDEWWAWGDLA